MTETLTHATPMTQANQLRPALADLLAVRPLPGYPGYGADANGQIWSLTSNWRGLGPRPMRSFPATNGYLQLRIKVDGALVYRKVHTLVTTAFHGPRPSPAHQVRHLDGDKANNRPSNLRWGTAIENAADKKRHGRQPDWSNPEFRARQLALQRAAAERRRR